LHTQRRHVAREYRVPRDCGENSLLDETLPKARYQAHDGWNAC